MGNLFGMFRKKRSGGPPVCEPGKATEVSREDLRISFTYGGTLRQRILDLAGCQGADALLRYRGLRAVFTNSAAFSPAPYLAQSYAEPWLREPAAFQCDAGALVLAVDTCLDGGQNPIAGEAEDWNLVCYASAEEPKRLFAAVAQAMEEVLRVGVFWKAERGAVFWALTVSDTPLDEKEPSATRSGDVYSVYVGGQRLTECRSAENKYMIYIGGDLGYEPMGLLRDHAVRELGFVLEEEYGITDMTQVYSCGERACVLSYCSEDDSIFLEMKATDREALDWLRQTALRLRQKIGRVGL